MTDAEMVPSNPGELVDVNDPDFEGLKRDFFIGLAVSEATALRLHKAAGLLAKNEDGAREWGNVTEHCLVVAARVGTLADALGLDEDLRQDLRTAAVLHDYFKKAERETVSSRGYSWESFSLASQLSSQHLRDKGVKPRVIKLSEAAGHEAIAEAEELAAKQYLAGEEIAFLIMHYVDDYTIGTAWVGPAETSDSTTINDLDRRVKDNEIKPQSRILNEYNQGRFQNETPFQAQQRVGHLVEQRLAGLIGVRTSAQVEPLDLPAYIDNLLRQKIQNAA